MTMPRYVVNMEEGLPFLIPEGGEDGETVDLERGYQRTKGLKMNVVNGFGIVDWVVDRPMYITGIKISTQHGNPLSPNKRYRDTLNFYIGDKLIYEDKYVVRQEDYINHRNIHAIDEGTFLEFVYQTNTEEGEVEEDKVVWIDIDYVADPVLQKVKIIHRLNETGDIIEEEEFKLSRGEYRIPLKQKGEFLTPITPFLDVVVHPTYNNFYNEQAIEYEILYEIM